jgi:hypothetical protein
MELTPEERQKIYLEEKARMEARARLNPRPPVNVPLAIIGSVAALAGIGFAGCVAFFFGSFLSGSDIIGYVVAAGVVLLALWALVNTISGKR